MYEIFNVNKDTEPSNDVVLLKIIDQLKSSSKYGNIHLPTAELVNIKLLRAEIVKLGHTAAEAGFKKGDVVLYDKYGAFYHPPETEGTHVLCTMENIICKIHPKTNKMMTYGENALIKVVKNEEEEIEGGIIIVDACRHEAEFYVVEAVGSTKNCEVKKGDRICFQIKDCDFISYSSEKYIVIPYHRILAIVKK